MKNGFELGVLNKKKCIGDLKRPKLIRPITAFDCDCSVRAFQTSAKIGKSKSKSMSVTLVAKFCQCAVKLGQVIRCKAWRLVDF